MGSITRTNPNMVRGSIGTGNISRGPGGSVGGSWTGPGGTTIGGIKGPGGGAAAGIRGPNGGTVGGIRGPNGGAIAGGNRPGGDHGWISNLPDNAQKIHHGDHDYYYHDHHYYHPYYYGDNWYYMRIAPPIGIYWDTVPDDYTIVVINNTQYYTNADGTYVVAADGKYKVVDTPAGVEKKPDPMEILGKMTTYVAQQKDFTVVAREVTEEILDSGAKAQVGSERTVHLRRPDKLAAEYRSAQGNRKFLFDKGNVTILDDGKKAYTTLTVPATIDGMLDELGDKYGVSVLLGDVLAANAFFRLTSTIQDAQYIGKSSDPVDCHHLAFSQENVDWEIWISDGKDPLPRKLLIVYKTLPGSPKYEVTLSVWDYGPNPDSVFVLPIPEGTKKINVTPPPPAAAATPAPPST